jgi:hypothetical protein
MVWVESILQKQKKGDGKKDEDVVSFFVASSVIVIP